MLSGEGCFCLAAVSRPRTRTADGRTHECSKDIQAKRSGESEKDYQKEVAEFCVGFMLKRLVTLSWTVVAITKSVSYISNFSVSLPLQVKEFAPYDLF